ncbi:golgin-45 [Euwallacea fornicatus]|uniref:golgin-45 n=1 Tax=Euwallacea fornicatus TaxID=995702 RepID=UPI00338D5416
MNPLDSGLPTRTLGDGMENNVTKLSEVKLPSKMHSKILKSMIPVQPQSKIINLVPKYVARDKKMVTNVILTKPKEPKFVPYEPYKAAVQPIKHVQVRTKKPVVKQQSSKNNIEIQELVQQMSEMRVVEMNKLKVRALQEDKVVPWQQWEKEKDAYEIDIKNLKETKAHLENQLKFQAQVNSELKTLLVAAVGEDLESRVQHLTEDKLSLARALLNSANHLTSHQEQTEWLSGQCEVWRSKFLASSLMVEELARWKSALTKRTNDLQEIVKLLLSDGSKHHKESVTTFSNLNAALEKLSGTKFQFREDDFTGINLKLSKEIAKCLDVKPVQEETNKNWHSKNEKLAVKVLKNPVSLMSQDMICNALVGAAHSLSASSEQKFMQNSLLHPCCAHCKGDVQDI